MAGKRTEPALPAMWSRLVGQEAAVASLGEALTSGNAGHAWLFVGPEGVGRRPAAFAFAAARICPQGGMGCGECASCAKVLRWAHPDVHLIVPEGQQILVDQIRGSTTDRGVIPEAYRTPTEGPAKVFVIEDAAQMNPHAANALLKVLEEPPAGVTFLLVTADADALPETVISRCRRVDFVPLGPQAIRRVLVEQHGLEEERAAWAARLGGNLARALRLAFDPQATTRRSAHLDLVSRLASGDLSEAIRAAEEIRAEAEDAAAALTADHERELAELAELIGEGRGTATQRKRLADRQKREARGAELDTYLYTLDDLATAYRDRLLGAVGAGEDLTVDGPPAGPGADLASVLRALELIERARLAIERNAQPRIQLEALFAGLGALPVS